MSETTERSAYDKLSPQRKQLADMLVANLDSGGLWKQGWRTRGAPENAVTGKKYRGVNNLYLFLVAMERGYSDNRFPKGSWRAKGTRSAFSICASRIPRRAGIP